MNLKGLALAAVLAASASASAEAAVVATQALVDFGTPTANTGDITTSTDFTIGDLVSTLNNTGDLAGLPSQSFGGLSFTTSSGTSFSFGDAAFGTFASSSITEISNVNHAVAFYILGDWTPGTFGGVPPGSYAGSVTLTYNQTGGTISDSASFAVPPSGNPGGADLGDVGPRLRGSGFCRLSLVAQEHFDRRVTQPPVKADAQGAPVNRGLFFCRAKYGPFD